MSIHSQDSDNEELGAIGGKQTISRQVSPFSRPSSVGIMESLAKTLTEQVQQQEHRLMQRMDTTNSTLTDMSARLERLERASPHSNLVELRTNPSDGNFVFH